MIYNPKEFELEKTTIWSFKERGKWATHKGDYRGNCPPQVPRNLILKYTKENDIVLDQTTPIMIQRFQKINTTNPLIIANM